MPMIDCKSIAKGILVDVADKVKTMEVKPTLYMTSFNGDGDALAKGLAKDCERVGISFKHSAINAGDGKFSYLTNGVDNLDPDMECVAEAVYRIVKCTCTHDALKDDLNGVVVMIIGRGKVGTAVEKRLKDADATVVICHSKTPKSVVYYMSGDCDAVVTCCDKPLCYDVRDFFGNTMPIIDCGFSVGSDGKSYGNVDTLGNKSANITPVPGGVGLVTRAIMVEKAVGV